MPKAPEGCNAFNREPLLHGKGNKNEVGYTNEGWLNIYALNCGYMENLDIEEKNVALWLEGVYHVKAFDYDRMKRICWESFDTVGEARKFFVKQVEALNDSL